jgi:hypothetical protein
MTTLELMTIALTRCGLTITASTYKNNGYKYLDVITTMLIGESQSWTFRRKKGTITTAASTQEYALASDFETPILAKNLTQNRKVQFRPLEFLEENDPDYSESGSITDLIIIGMDTTNDVVNVIGYPVPDGIETINYWYNQAMPVFTSSLDDIDLQRYAPRWFQNCMLFGLSAMFHSEKGDMEGAGVEFDFMNKNLGLGIRMQAQMNGDTNSKVGGSGHISQQNSSDFLFTVREGALS